jgi:hypothetical protein
MNKRFLTKNIKINTITEAEAKAKGLGETEKIQKQSKKHNDEGLKDGYTKLSELYDFDNGKDENALENPPKVNREDELDAYEIEAKGAGKMQGIKYDNEDTDVHSDFEKRVDELNDTSEYDKEFGTHDGFGEGEKDNVYDELKKAGEDFKKHKYGEDKDGYQETPKVRVKEGTMKRMNYKQEFKDEKHMLSLIPESYKVDDHVFLMANVNETYQVRWEGDAETGEGVSLLYKNEEKINESKNTMKKLFDYKRSSVVGKTNDYINETVQFQKMMDVLREGKQ